MYFVESYQPDKLLEILAAKSTACPELIRKRPHYSYLVEYLDTLKALTIVVECEYIDRDYLEDFAGYYVLCFKNYSKKCTRIHFFSTPFEQQAFEDLLKGIAGELKQTILREHYLGFVVVRPLPETIIGRTCLKTYGPDGGRRVYPVTRSYEANLFGIQLPVKSIAFQEQDHVVAACATSALWSAFHGTSQWFQNPVPSPVKITKAATRLIPVETRVLPNKGLTGEQMAHAIRNVGLEPFLISAGSEYVLKKTVYAYLKCGIPIILGLILRDTSDKPDPGFPGRHAVAITGFSMGHPKPIPLKKTGFCLKASRIDKLYAHDDQVGPFARMIICGDRDQNDISYLTTSWVCSDGCRGRILGEPAILLIPLYHKIRIPFEIIHDTVFCFHENVMEPLFRNQVLTLEEKVEWDIYLTTVNAFKSELIESDLYATEVRCSLLVQSLPRFLWRATACCGNKRILDLLFDATDLEQAPFLALAVNYDSTLFNMLELVAEQPDLLGIIKSDLEWKVLSWFEKRGK